MAISAPVNVITVNVVPKSPDAEIGYTKAMIKDDIISALTENPGGDGGAAFFAEELASILIRIKGG